LEIRLSVYMLLLIHTWCFLFTKSISEWH